MAEKIGYIDDGYTIAAVIPETDNEPKVNFTYRPTTYRERLRHAESMAAIRKAGEDNFSDIMQDKTYELMTEKIIEWDLQDRHGKKIVVSVVDLEFVASDIQTSMLMNILGHKDPILQNGNEAENQPEKN